MRTRQTHQLDAQLVAPGWSDEVAQQDAIDKSYGEQHIQPGSLTIAKYAQTIRPVAIVDDLPDLPNDDYPENSYAVLTTTNRLYKNIGDVWVLGIDGADIVADSITAGQIAAGAISATELAVGAWNAGNLLKNGGFEEGITAYGTTDLYLPGWSRRSSTEYGFLTSVNARSGTHVSVYRSTTGLSAPGFNQTVDVIPGRTYRLSGWCWKAVAGGQTLVLRATSLDSGGGIVAAAAIGPLHNSTTGTPTFVEGTFTVPDDGTVTQLRIETVAGGNPLVSEIFANEDLTLELIPAGARNTSGRVLIDENGILIQNGELTIEDEFGKSSFNASGVTGSWEDYTLTGIKNGSFGSNDAAASAALGRTSDVPYWTLAQGSGTPTFTSGVGSLEISFGTVGHRGEFTSDLIRVRQGVPLVIYINDSVPDLAFTEVTREVRVLRYNSTAGLIGSTTLRSDTLTGSGGQTVVAGHVTPDDYTGIGADVCAFIKIYVRVTAVTLALGAASYVCNEVMLVAGDTVPRVVGFPSNPELLSRVHYSGMDWYYDGTQWLCTCEHTQDFIVTTTTTVPLTASASNRWHVALPTTKGFNIYIEAFECAFLVVSGGTALDGSNRWNANIRAEPAASIIGTFTISSGADNTWRVATETDPVTVDITSSQVALSISWAKTGTPGNLTFAASVRYRFIGA